MIDAPQLLADLTRELRRLEDDLRRRVDEQSAVDEGLRAEWQAARAADRSAEPFETWVEQVITQASVHWLLNCVFLRFIEDNRLVERPWLGGTPESGRLALARDRHEAYFQANPLESDREYLLAAFREAGALPGLHTFFDEAHNPVFRMGISGDAAMALRQFWQKIDPNTGALKHDFTDATWNTRFLGDLYQDLSEATRKRYALLQTPEFVEEFILDRTLTPAIREFGYREVRMIDPTCGSGHFLLGGFARVLAEWQSHEPGRNPVDLAQKALDAVAGVDLNPFAVAISRFRLLVATLQASGVHRLADAPDFRMAVAIGDSLLHGRRFGLTATDEMFEDREAYVNTGLAHAYASEDLEEVNRILGRQYHAVVGNPPYIIVKDAALNAAYRRRYVSCHRQYSLGCPFTERFFELALTGNGRPAGYVGLITANSFMKREFGSKLIEQVLPRLDLTHVVDTSGAYIPGHGTPTVILFGRHRAPVADTMRMVMGIKGEPTAPDEPARGLVWSSIVGQIDNEGSEGEFVSVGDMPRATFLKHPWSLGGGGAADLQELIEGAGVGRLSDVIGVHRFVVNAGGRTFTRESREIGFVGMTHADEVMNAPMLSLRRRGVEECVIRPLVEGDAVRDWQAGVSDAIVFPYADGDLVNLAKLPMLARWLWPSRTSLAERATFGGGTYKSEGRAWWEWHQVALRRVQGSSLAFAEIATHNHFIFDRGGKVFKQTAPVIKLPAGSSEDEHLGLLGLLNSSVACFWLKQVCFNKGNGGIGGGISDEKWELRYAHNASQVAEFPLVENRPVDIATRLDMQSRQLADLHPDSLLAKGPLPTRPGLTAAREEAAQLRRLMIARQEELDWRCYRLYGLLPTDGSADHVEYAAPVEVALGERAFEIVLARRLAAGDEQTTWFERHGSTPTAEIPAHWPEEYRRVVQRRIELIEQDKNIGLIERPEFKRRWNTPRWEDLEQAALREWLLTRLESPTLWPTSAGHPPQLTSTARLADAVQQDAEFMQIAALYAGHADFDLHTLIAELVAAESVPFLPVLRYTETGLRKRAQWEGTWTLQRAEDTIDVEVNARADARRKELIEFATREAGGAAPDAEAQAWVEKQIAEEFDPIRKERKAVEVGAVTVPPKYKSSDFLKSDFWRLRGGLDVPKERFVSYPGCERGADGSLVVAWAGWNHLQQATALASYAVEMKDTEGWEPARLQPLLAGLLELVPWLEQWHNEVDPAYGERMGSYYRSFVLDEARALGFTLEDLYAWRPAVAVSRRGRKKTTTPNENAATR